MAEIIHLPFHPLANLFPLIEGEEFEALCADIDENGLRQPVLLWRGAIIDGRNRYRALHEIGAVSPETGEGAADLVALGFAADVSHWPHDELARRVISLNLHRRHLDTAQRAMIAAKIATMRHGGARRGGDDAGGEGAAPDQAANLPLEISVDQAAAMLNVSPRSVRTAKAIERVAPAELTEAVSRGAVSLHEAQMDLAAAVGRAARETADLGRAGEAVSEDAVAEAYRQIKAEREAAKQAKKARRQAREAELGEKIARGNDDLARAAASGKRYGVILADPEWRFEPYSRESGMDRAADNHYPTSPTAVIAARPVAEIAARDCVLFLWATAPMLPDALQVMAAWGFTYRSHCIWRKDRPGTGYWFVSEHELLLVGTRGDVPCPAPGTQARSVIDAPLGAHSEKPGFAHEMIERLFPTLPKIELNARAARAGWDVWGAEAPEAPEALTPLTPEACRARREALGLTSPQLARAGMLAPVSVRNFEAGHFDASPAWRGMVAGVLARLEADKGGV